jgi:hypothetical protein
MVSLLLVAESTTSRIQNASAGKSDNETVSNGSSSLRNNWSRMEFSVKILLSTFEKSCSSYGQHDYPYDKMVVIDLN